MCTTSYLRLRASSKNLLGSERTRRTPVRWRSVRERFELKQSSTIKPVSGTHNSPLADNRGSAILSFGYAQPELKRKHEVLAKRGFGVASLSEFNAVKKLITTEGQKFRLLLVGPMVPERERQALSKLYRRRCPQGNVIFFYRDSISNAGCATALLSEERFPQNLLDAVSLLNSQRRED